MEKSYSREHSLFYCCVWNESNRRDFENHVRTNVRNLIFIGKENGVVDVWYEKEGLAGLYTFIGKEIKRDSEFFPRAKKLFEQKWDVMWPYNSGSKKVETMKEMTSFYDDWMLWWAPMAIMLCIPDIADVPKDISAEAMAMRSKVQHYSATGDMVFLDFFTRHFPQYESIKKVLTPDEVFSLENSPFTDEQVRTFEKRNNAFVLFNSELIDPASLPDRMRENNLIFETIGGKDSRGFLKGMSAYGGKVKGKVKIVHTMKDASSFRSGEILVTPMTDPRYVPIMKMAAAIITDEGGVTCHAAITSRELKVPCIVGTKVATQSLKDGDMVAVDADAGIARKVIV